jgi:hypothetical protein
MLIIPCGLPVIIKRLSTTSTSKYLQMSEIEGFKANDEVVVNLLMVPRILCLHRPSLRFGDA